MVAPYDPTLGALIALYMRAPAYWDATGTPVWTPVLTSAEQATLADLRTMARFGISTDITLAEFQAFKADAANAKAYLGLASPTNAQTVAALKSVIRVVGALLRS